MKIAEFLENILPDRFRAAAAGIIGKPPAVDSPDEMIGDDKRIHHDLLPSACGLADPHFGSAKPQAGDEKSTALPRVPAASANSPGDPSWRTTTSPTDCHPCRNAWRNG